MNVSASAASSANCYPSDTWLHITLSQNQRQAAHKLQKNASDRVCFGAGLLAKPPPSEYNRIMRFDIFTIFPDIFPSYLESSILHRASERGLLEVGIHNIRDWTTDKHRMTDDEPYGGGGGMVMKPEPIFRAVEGVLGVPSELPHHPVYPTGTSVQSGDGG